MKIIQKSLKNHPKIIKKRHIFEVLGPIWPLFGSWGRSGVIFSRILVSPGSPGEVPFPTFRRLFFILFSTIFRRCFFLDFSMVLEMDFGVFFDTFWHQADLVKIVPEPLREPRSGGSGALKKLTFFILFWTCFSKAVRGMIFHDFWYLFGIQFTLFYLTFAIPKKQ